MKLRWLCFLGIHRYVRWPNHRYLYCARCGTRGPVKAQPGGVVIITFQPKETH